MGRYVHSASICNTLALLMSQGTVVEFLQRMSLLMKLQNCWTKGHSDIKLHCASDGDSHDDMCQLSLEELASELQSVGKDMTGSICSSEGIHWCNSATTNIGRHLISLILFVYISTALQHDMLFPRLSQRKTQNIIGL